MRLKKIFLGLMCVTSMFIITACGSKTQHESSNSKEEQTETTEKKKTESANEEKKEPTGNPLLDAQIKEADVKNGSGNESIGIRKYIEISSSDFEKMTDEQLSEFALNVVDKQEDVNWFTIISGNKGIQFPGCMIEGAMYGTIDGEGIIQENEYFVSVKKDGSVSWEEDTETY